MKLARLREWRYAQGMTQKDLAREAGIGEITPARLEAGHEATPTTARKIANALDVRVVDLLESPPTRADDPKGAAPSRSGREDTERRDIKGPGREWPPDRWRPNSEELSIPEPGGVRHTRHIADPGDEVTISKHAFDEVMEEIREKRLSTEAAWERLKKDTA